MRKGHDSALSRKCFMEIRRGCFKHKYPSNIRTSVLGECFWSDMIIFLLHFNWVYNRANKSSWNNYGDDTPTHGIWIKSHKKIIHVFNNNNNNFPVLYIVKV